MADDETGMVLHELKELKQHVLARVSVAATGDGGAEARIDTLIRCHAAAQAIDWAIAETKASRGSVYKNRGLAGFGDR